MNLMYHLDCQKKWARIGVGLDRINKARVHMLFVWIRTTYKNTLMSDSICSTGVAGRDDPADVVDGLLRFSRRKRFFSLKAFSRAASECFSDRILSTFSAAFSCKYSGFNVRSSVFPFSGTEGTILLDMVIPLFFDGILRAITCRVPMDFWVAVDPDAWCAGTLFTGSDRWPVLLSDVLWLTSSVKKLFARCRCIKLCGIAAVEGCRIFGDMPVLALGVFELCISSSLSLSEVVLKSRITFGIWREDMILMKMSPINYPFRVLG